MNKFLPQLTDQREQWPSVWSSCLEWSGRVFVQLPALCDWLALADGTPSDWLNPAGSHTWDWHASTSDLNKSKTWLIADIRLKYTCHRLHTGGLWRWRRQWWANLKSQSFSQISNLLEKRFESKGQISNLKSHCFSKSKIFSEQISNQIPNLCWNTDYRKLPKITVTAHSFE